jgi:hypothetical protein
MGAPYLYWQKAPLGWRDAPAVVALAASIRKRDPRLFLLDLWDWAKVHGDDHPVATAVEAIERGAGWRGKRGIFYQGLVAAGWVRETDGRVIILDWDKDEIVKGRPTLAGVVPNDEVLNTDEKSRIGARKRQQKSRAKKNPVTHGNVTERDAGVTCHSESVTGRDASVTRIFSTPSNVAESPVYAGIVTPKSKREEEDKDKEPEKNLALFAAAPSEATKEKAPRGRPPKDTPEIVTDREQWLEKARALVGLTPEQTPPSKQLCILFAQQRKKRGMEQLLRSLEGLEKDPWAKQQGLQPLLSDAVIEKGLAKWNKGASGAHVSRTVHAVGTGDAFMRSMWGEE